MEFSSATSTREEIKSGARTPSGLGGVVSKLTAVKFLLLLVLIAQVATVWFVINPPYLAQQTIANQVVQEVAKLTTVNISEQPQVAVVTDADQLREENSVQASVYKDAQKGDYVIAFTDKMIIFRRPDQKIVYEGDSPATIANKNEATISDAVIAKAKEAGLIASDSTEKPQLSVVTDAAAVKTQDATFYANVANDDIIASFPTARVIILYRSSTGNMINSGTFNTVISAQ
jgi:hypothetical protein